VSMSMRMFLVSQLSGQEAAVPLVPVVAIAPFSYWFQTFWDDGNV
jgi:hypothetical protein